MKNLTFLILLIPFFTIAQNKKTKVFAAENQAYTQSGVRLQSFSQHQNLVQNSLVSQVKFRNAGPNIMSGRVADVSANPDNPAEFYVAYASGGLWRTTNNGMSFTPVFDHEAAMTIGDIAVNWKKNIIWVGTGENNSSRSSYAGTGIYKSTDTGKTWNYSGLGESHHIGRIVLDENNPDVAWVAVLGHLYTPNKERGIFKTSDGGKTWKQTLMINDSTGCIDLVRDPNNKNILYAAAWQRMRTAWNFVGDGSGSGIYKSTDAGETWKLMTTASSGFPTGKGVGRIGLASVNNNGNTVIYAILDNQFYREKKKEDTTKLTRDMLKTMNAQKFLALDKKKVAVFLTANGFPEKYSADTIIGLVKSGQITPQTLYDYVYDEDRDLFESDVIGAQLYRSDDGGTTWKKTHDGNIDDMFYTYGYYFSQVRTVENNPNKVYLLGFVILKSDDGGKTFSSLSTENVHPDNHALWVDEKLPGHLILGNDGGLNLSYDDGKTWLKLNSPSVGQFYSVNVDLENPYNIYGGLQDNGCWYGPNNFVADNSWQGSGLYPFKLILDGDGMQVAVDTRGNSVVYAGYQFGNYFRVNLLTNNAKFITPKHELGEHPLRWNWQSPISISTHNQDIIYFGSNRLYRSFDRGEHFDAISPDLTQGGKKGNVPYGTITTIHESPLKFSLIYTGSDDGLIYLTKDGGNTWTKISNGLPQNLWVSRVQASKFSPGRVYASLNGYRNDDFTPYLFVSEDYGTTWTRIGNDLPMEPINVVKEDPSSQNILYVGTDNGLYISLDRGKTFMAMMGGLPNVPVHDLIIQPEAHDLVIGTHGRSVYIANLNEVEQLSDSVLQKTIFALSHPTVDYNSGWGKRDFTWDTIFKPDVTLPVYLSQSGKVSISIYADSSLALRQWQADGKKGINYFHYNAGFDSTLKGNYKTWLNKDVKDKDDSVKVEKGDDKNYYLKPGKYRCEITMNGMKIEETLNIRNPNQGKGAGANPEPKEDE